MSIVNLLKKDPWHSPPLETVYVCVNRLLWMAAVLEEDGGGEELVGIILPFQHLDRGLGDEHQKREDYERTQYLSDALVCAKRVVGRKFTPQFPMSPPGKKFEHAALPGLNPGLQGDPQSTVQRRPTWQLALGGGRGAAKSASGTQESKAHNESTQVFPDSQSHIVFFHVCNLFSIKKSGVRKEIGAHKLEKLFVP